MYGPKTYRYEFEAKDRHYAYEFMKVLNAFGIIAEDFDIVPPYAGVNFAIFWCTKKQRTRIEYVYRRLLGLNKRSIVPDEYLGNQEKARTEGYYIL